MKQINQMKTEVTFLLIPKTVFLGNWDTFKRARRTAKAQVQEQSGISQLSRRTMLTVASV